jgi:thiamine-phosphate pyrophosphorylase
LLLYYITNRRQFPGDEPARRATLLQKISEAARCGVDYIQLREKDLSGRELESLACAAVQVVRKNSAADKSATRILINSRTDLAIACAADGVHLTSTDVDPADVRSVWRAAASPSSVKTPHPNVAKSATLGWGTQPIIAVSCHSVEDMVRAASSGADFAVLAPVFEKRDAPDVRPAGLEVLRDVCRQPIPVVALGGITLENARPCIEAGAAGIAAIRLFQENEIADVVRRLRGESKV